MSLRWTPEAPPAAELRYVIEGRAIGEDWRRWLSTTDGGYARRAIDGHRRNYPHHIWRLLRAVTTYTLEG